MKTLSRVLVVMVLVMPAIQAAFSNDGPFETYFENGQMEERGSYREGNKEGLWERYYDNGQLQSRSYYTGGRKDGRWEDYYDNGQLHYKGLYEDDKKNGRWEYYYRSGQLDYEGAYEDDKKNGQFKHYHTNGQLRSYRHYRRDIPVVWQKDYYDNGQLYRDGEWQNGKQAGQWSYYHKNGELMKEESFEEGKLVTSMTIERARRALLDAREFTFGRVGYFGVKPEGLKAFWTIRRYSTNAVEVFDSVLQNGNAQGKMYALCGLRIVDKAVFERRVNILPFIIEKAGDKYKMVETADGCVYFSTPTLKVVKMIAEGRYDRELGVRNAPVPKIE